MTRSSTGWEKQNRVSPNEWIQTLYETAKWETKKVVQFEVRLKSYVIECKKLVNELKNEVTSCGDIKKKCKWNWMNLWWITKS